MPLPPTWNDMRIRAKEFADEWKDATSEQADKHTFWNEFFEIFGLQRKSVGVYEKAVSRLGRHSGFIDMFWPGKLIVEHKSRGESLEPAFNQAADYAANLNHDEHPRYIIVSDFHYIKLYDLATTNKQSEWTISLEDLPSKLDLFGFIAGYNRQEYVEQHPVDIKASKQLTKIHDELRKTGYGGQDLEILLVRLLFCMFAEDNGVFEKNQFQDFIYERTSEDASDLGPKLIQLFQTLNKPVNERQSNLDEHLLKFQYVNGKLFDKPIETPSFNHNMRYSLIEATRNNDWGQINPAIFGAMFQNVMQESGTKKRRELGAHYTSEKNILKVIKPLFLDDLRAEFEEVKQNRGLLTEFHDKLANLNFLDPACGCGNFLVVAYRELRKLELEVLKVIYGHLGEKGIPVDLKSAVKCNVDQFYGIEFEEFPSQVAQVAMWLTDAQMNNEAQKLFHKPLVRLPLTHSATIVHGDALEINWQSVVPNTELDYILGNPPFSGGKLMTQFQRDQIKNLFPPGSGAGVLDFVAGWYAKAIAYIQGTDIAVAFVSTNSITQGEQVGILWKHLLEYGAKINFAHKTFKWANEASGKAAVYCVVIGFDLKGAYEKALYEYATLNGDPVEIEVANINPYLVDYEDVLITKRSKPIAKVPEIKFGNQPIDGGNLILSEQERKDALEAEPEIAKYIRQYMGSEELINKTMRYCLWLKDADPSEVSNSPFIKNRLEKVRQSRLASDRKATQDLAISPGNFAFISHTDESYVAIPSVSSENRRYVPMVFNTPDIIASNLCLIIPNANLYHFGVLESEMHMTWMRHVAGRLESRYRYSNTLVYNNFYWPDVSDEQKTVIETAAQEILNTRDEYPDSSLADLYNTLTMPAKLLKAHRQLDRAVDKAYRKEPFGSEDDRIKYLFERYKQLTK